MLPAEQISEAFLEPTFIEHDDCVFLECQFSKKNYDFWLEFYEKEAKGRGAVEAMVNGVRVDGLFLDTAPEISARIAKEAAAIVIEIWRAKLRLVFPARHFEFDFSLGAPPKASRITFYQAKHRSSTS